LVTPDAGVSAPARDDAGLLEDAGLPALDRVTLDLVAIAGIVGIVLGLSQLAGGELGFTGVGVLDGVAGQLPETLPAALLILAVVGINLAAGTVIARLALGTPFRSRGDLVLAGFAGAVLLDVAGLVLLGGLGVHRQLVLLVVHVGLIALARRAWPFLAPVVPPSPGPSPIVWVYLVAAWSGAVVLQLASPVVPFMDVLPNHVAPAEHLRTFGSWSELGLTPSPIYGPSRTFLGYASLMGSITTMAALPAALAVAASILPGMLLVAAGVHRLASAIGGARVGLWALVTFTLTTSFARLPDARATVLVLPLVLFALALLVERYSQAEVDEDTGTSGDGAAVTDAARTRGRRDWLAIGGALGAAILVHPVIGALAFVTGGFVVLAKPDRVGLAVVPGLVVAAILALLQVAVMVDVTVPTLLVLPALAIAPAAGWLVARSPAVVDGLILLGRAGALSALFVVAYLAVELMTAALETLTKVLVSLPLLLLGSLAAVTLAPRRAGHPVLLAALAAAAVAAVAVGLAPAGNDVFGALRYEMGKTLQYWIPVMLALIAAVGLDAVWRHDGLTPAARVVIVGGVALVIALPLRPEPIDKFWLGERRLGESLSQAFHWAEIGYWDGYPDARRVIDAPRQGLVDAVRREIEAGGITADTAVLHVAGSFQQWQATPLGVFSGVIETIVSAETEASIHTAGGRLHPIEDLDELLASGAYQWLLLEPDGQLPADTRDRIVEAGYAPAFANERGELFRLAPASTP
jgi:hypothetical protein